MPHDDLEEQVIAIIAKKREVDPSALTLDSTFDQLGIDSCAAMDLIFTFEDKFQIDIPDAVALQIKTVRQVAEALRPIVNGRSADSN
jgi:acyl carrier protein